MSSFVNTNLRAAQDRKKRANDLYSRTQERVGGWKTTPSGMRAGTVQVVSAGGDEKIRVSNKVMLSGTITDEIINDSETAIDVADGTKFAVGETIRIESEHMYIQSISSNTLTVVRETDGTDAAAHGPSGLDIYKINPKTPTRYTELSGEALSFHKDGSTFNYPKQMQFIPASALTFGSAFDFTINDLVDYDDDQYDVMFILKNMQVFNVADVAADQAVQFSAESKSATGFTPTANIYVGDTLTVTTVTSFEDANAAFGGTTLSTPAYDTAKTANDAYDDSANSVTDSDAVISCSVTFTITYSAVKGTGVLETSGYIRAGTSDASTAFASARYLQTDFTDFRDAGFGDGSNTRTINFDFGGDLGDPARVVLTITNYSQLFGSTATMAAALTSIAYTTSDGTTRAITGANKADAIVIAR